MLGFKFPPSWRAALSAAGDRLEAIRAWHWLHPPWRTAVTTVRIYGAIDGELRAASFAYYVFFSIFPLVALILTVGSHFFSPSDLVGMIKGFLPLDDEQQAFLWNAVGSLEAARGGVGMVSLAIFAWCSLRFFHALVGAVNRAWHTVENRWWEIPMKNLAMIAILLSALFGGLLLPALLQGARLTLVSAGDWLHMRFPDFNLPLVTWLLDLTRYAIGAVALFYSFSLLYMVAPRLRVTFRQVWLAALAVTLALQFCQIAFVNYLPRFVNYGIYGAVGSLMLLLLWVYASGVIIIFGGCLCAAREQVRAEMREGPATRTSSKN